MASVFRRRQPAWVTRTLESKPQPQQAPEQHSQPQADPEKCHKLRQSHSSISGPQRPPSPPSSGPVLSAQPGLDSLAPFFPRSPLSREDAVWQGPLPVTTPPPPQKQWCSEHQAKSLWGLLCKCKFPGRLVRDSDFLGPRTLGRGVLSDICGTWRNPRRAQVILHSPGPPSLSPAHPALLFSAAGAAFGVLRTLACVSMCLSGSHPPPPRTSPLHLPPPSLHLQGLAQLWAPPSDLGGCTLCVHGWGGWAAAPSAARSSPTFSGACGNVGLDLRPIREGLGSDAEPVGHPLRQVLHLQPQGAASLHVHGHDLTDTCEGGTGRVGTAGAAGSCRGGALTGWGGSSTLSRSAPGWHPGPHSCGSHTRAPAGGSQEEGFRGGRSLTRGPDHPMGRHGGPSAPPHPAELNRCIPNVLYPRVYFSPH